MSRKEKVYVVPNQVTPNKTIVFNPKVCDGCTGLPEPLCMTVCTMDALFPNPDRSKPPILVYPDECGGCNCGCCVGACPYGDEGAIEMKYPLMHNVRWKDKKTGKHYRVGMPNPPPPNPRPPVSGWGWAGKYEKPKEEKPS